MYESKAKKTRTECDSGRATTGGSRGHRLPNPINRHHPPKLKGGPAT
jgi:hypothetical protein